MSRKLVKHYPETAMIADPVLGSTFGWKVGAASNSTDLGYAPGGILIDVTNADVYVNSGTKTSPTWLAIAGTTVAAMTITALTTTTLTLGATAVTATAAEINARCAAASRRVAITDTSTYTVLAANNGKVHIFPDLGQTCTVAMPALSDGLEYTFISKAIAADASDWRFQGAEAGTSFLGGSSFADSDAGPASDEIHAGLYPNGSSNDFFSVITPQAGTRVYMICDGTNWIVNAQVISATVPAFADT